MSRFFVNMTMVCLVAFYWLAATTPVQASELYIFDKSHTSITFSVSRFGLFEINGRFKDYDGNFVYCIQHPQKDVVTITLYSAGIESSDEDRNDELRGPDFFNASRFPIIKFTSTSVEQADDNSAQIIGNLTLLGITKPVTFNAHYTEKDHDATAGDYVVSFDASATINRSDFGMTYLIPFIGDEVRLNIHVKGIEKDGG